MTRLFVFATALLALSAAPARAAWFTLDDYSISYNNSDPGLRLYVTEVLPTAHSFSLTSVNQSYTRELFRIGTDEGSIESDDQVAKPISVNFAFSSPTSFGGALGGTTDGFIRPFTSCGLLAGGCGELDWNGGITLNFGTTGQLGVRLENVTFGTPGSSGVDVRFTLLREDTQTTRPSSSVPEPTSLMLLGGGLMMAAARFRRRSTTSE